MTARRVGRAAAVLATVAGVLALALGPAFAVGPGRRVARPHVNRVLIVSLPAVSWADLRDASVPNLDRLFRASAVADLSARSAQRHSDAGDGYLTLGAGARAIAPSMGSGLAFATNERYAGDAAGAVYRRRAGRAPGAGLVNLTVAAAAIANERLLYDAQPGALGDALARARVGRAVIANADYGEAVVGDDRYQRQAVSALMGSDGRVPAGRVDLGLLSLNASAAFGLHLNTEVVVRAFQAAWGGPAARKVVLVEASDLARVDAYRALATPARRAQLLHEALARTDVLVGRLLAAVDPRHDAVLVVTPSNPARRVQLGVAALRAPGVTRALLRSATTRRSGFVQIVDIAPTVLAQLGVPQPERMEGRPFETGARGGTAAQRRVLLIDADRAARFRDANVGVAVAVLVAFAIVLASATLLALEVPGPRRWARAVLAWTALALVGFLIATFLAGLFPFARWGNAAYWGFVAAMAAALATSFLLLGRRTRIGPVVLALGALVALHVGDVVTGAHLELNTVFGYSPTVGIRVAGMGNMGYAQLTAAAVLLAGLLAVVVGGRRGAWVAAALLALVLVCVGAPMLGQNFGGTLAAAPAFAVTTLVLFERRVSAAVAVALGALVVASGLAVGFVDLSRPSNERTHVGRFFEKVGNEGWHGFSIVIRRKLQENLGTFHQAGWVLLIAVAVVLLLYRAYARPRAEAGPTRVPLRAPLAGFVVLAVLGLVLKDSGTAVPAMMTAVLDPLLIFLTVRLT